MAQRKRKLSKRKKINPTLAAMFKMTREELQQRKVSGAGPHRPKGLDHRPRSEQKRRAIEEQLD